MAEIEKPHLIFVSETWFNHLSAPNIDGYRLFRRDRDGCCGGVAIYASANLIAIEVATSELRSCISSFNKVEQQYGVSYTLARRLC